MSWDTCHNINYTEPTIGGTGGGGGSVTLTGDVTGSGTSPITTTISTNAVTFAKFQQISTNKLLGRTTAGTGNVEELSMGAGIATFLATPTSANLAAAVTDETGSGALVFGTSPTLTTPRIANAGFIADENGNEQIKFATTASAVNEITLKNAATGNAVEIQATGGDTNISTKFVPKGTGVFYGVQETFIIAISDETTAITTGTAKATFRIPYAFKILKVRASLTTFSTSGTPTFDINESGVSILSTKITIDVNETTSVTAAVPPVISDDALSENAEITIDIDVAGTGATGAKIYIIGYATGQAG